MTFVPGQQPWNKGKTYSARHKGRPLSTEHRLALCVPRLGAGQYPRTQYHKDVTREGINRAYQNGVKMGFRLKKYLNSGEKNNNWKGGITPLNEKVRKSPPYLSWRKAVFERDDYTCQDCGVRGGVDLHADHVKMFAFHPDLRLKVDNGRTLCVDCHRSTDTYGGHEHKCCAKIEAICLT